MLSVNPRLTKTVNSMSQSTPMVFSFADTLQTVNASPEIVFGSSGLYWNLSAVSSLLDFTDQSNSFYFIKFQKIVLELHRTADEVTMYNNLRGGDIYINYYPHLSSTAINYSTLSRDVNSYNVDVQTFDIQRVNIPLPDYCGVTTSGTTEYWLNAIKPILMNYVQYLNGQITIRTSNSTNNNAAVVLFKVLIKFHVTLYHRM